MRNEFIGLKLIDVLKNLRSRGVSDDLVVQLDVFEEQRESDEEHIKGRGSQLDYTGHQLFPNWPQFCKYRGSSPYANFITAIFQNFPDTYLAYVFWGLISFHYCNFLAIFGPKITLAKYIFA